jgi:hypothetical protein
VGKSMTRQLRAICERPIPRAPSRDSFSRYSR